MQQRAYVIGSLGVLAVLLVTFAILIVSVASQRGSSSLPTASLTATPISPTVTPSPQPLHVTTAQGWVVPAALRFGQAVAFSTSDPLTGYVCGSPLVGADGSSPMELSATHDGGRTWSAPTSITPNGQDCRLSVDPADARDVLIFVGGCKITCDSFPAVPWRSSDGGATWRQMPIPSGDEDSRVEAGAYAWDGTTLFLTVRVSGNYAVGAPGGIPYPQHLIAASVGGQPFVWTNDSAIATAAHQFGFVDGIYPVTGGVALYLGQITGCDQQQVCSLRLYTTTDNGSTWHSNTPSGTVPQQTVGYTPDGGFVVGAIPNVTLTRSTDGGHTWSALPADLVPSTAYGLPAIVTSDRSIFVADVANGPIAFSVLAPNATHWRTITTGSSDYVFDAVSTLPGGTPNALWCATHAFTNGVYHPGIAYHAP